LVPVTPSTILSPSSILPYLEGEKKHRFYGQALEKVKERLILASRGQIDSLSDLRLFPQSARAQFAFRVAVSNSLE
jgi:hypothetical protein